MDIRATAASRLHNPEPEPDSHRLPPCLPSSLPTFHCAFDYVILIAFRVYLLINIYYLSTYHEAIRGGRPPMTTWSPCKQFNIQTSDFYTTKTFLSVSISGAIWKAMKEGNSWAAAACKATQYCHDSPPRAPAADGTIPADSRPSEQRYHYGTELLWI